MLDSLHNIVPASTRQEALQAEEVCIEDWREHDLVDQHFQRNAADLRGVIEVAREEEEPVVSGNRCDAANEERAHCPVRVVRRNLLSFLVSIFFSWCWRDALCCEVADEVDDQCRDELNGMRSARMHASVRVEWLCP